MICPWPLLVLRHGQTVWNAEHRIQGRLDSPLTALGKQQALNQRRILQYQDLNGYRAFCSPQGRAFHTASLVLDGIMPTIQTDIRLVEIGVGDWEGLHRGELATTKIADESEESALDLYEQAPNGEGFVTLRRRCVEFLESLDGPAVVVTHGITSRMLRLIQLDRDISEIGSISGGQGVIYRVEDRRQTKLTIGA